MCAEYLQHKVECVRAPGLYTRMGAYFTTVNRRRFTAVSTADHEHSTFFLRRAESSDWRGKVSRRRAGSRRFLAFCSSVRALQSRSTTVSHLKVKVKPKRESSRWPDPQPTRPAKRERHPTLAILRDRLRRSVSGRIQSQDRVCSAVWDAPIAALEPLSKPAHPPHGDGAPFCAPSVTRARFPPGRSHGGACKPDLILRFHEESPAPPVLSRRPSHNFTTAFSRSRASQRTDWPDPSPSRHAWP